MQCQPKERGRPQAPSRLQARRRRSGPRPGHSYYFAQSGIVMTGQALLRRRSNSRSAPWSAFANMISRRQSPSSEGVDADRSREGFAAVDAIVALSILAVTIMFSLQAGFTALRVARSAAETRAATRLLRYTLALPTTLPRVGSTEAFNWRLDVHRDDSARKGQGVAICVRRAHAVSRTSGKHFRSERLQVCSFAVPTS